MPTKAPEHKRPRTITPPPPDRPALVAVPALLLVATVAGLLDCSTRTVRWRIAEGSLAAVTDHGRIVVRADDLPAYVDALKRVRSPSGSLPRHSPRVASRSAADDEFAWLTDSTQWAVFSSFISMRQSIHIRVPVSLVAAAEARGGRGGLAEHLRRRRAGRGDRVPG